PSLFVKDIFFVLIEINQKVKGFNLFKIVPNIDCRCLR
ncbi:MAG: hypothetical protein ACI9XR_002230, partial [Flavobacterium sp.]